MKNEEFEKVFLNVAVKKEHRVRIAYELSNKKKRIMAIKRFSHQSNIFLNDKIDSQLIKLDYLSKLLSKDKNDAFYVVSLDYLDGVIFDCSQCLNYLYYSSTAIVVGKHFVLIKEEPEGSFVVHCFLI